MVVEYSTKDVAKIAEVIRNHDYSIYHLSPFFDRELKRLYEKFEIGFRNIHLTKDGIQDLIAFLEDNDNFNPVYGIGVSVIINNSPDDLLYFKVKKSWDYLGMFNLKNIQIEAIGERLGDGIGSYMRKGKLIVKGDVRDFCGAYMTGGELNIDGEVGNYLGMRMERGTIIVKGKKVKEVGIGAKGGKITKK